MFWKKTEIFLRNIFLLYFFLISVNFQNSSGTTMTVTMTANFVIQNSPRLLPTYIITKEKFETDRHVHHLLTDAPTTWGLGVPKIWDNQKSNFLTHFVNFGHEGTPNVTQINYDM